MLNTQLHCQGNGLKSKQLGMSGQSLISVMVGMAVTGIAITAFTSMMSYHQKETKALAEKLAVLELKSLLISVLSNGSVCQYELNNNPNYPPSNVSTFDSSSVTTIAATSISVNQIRASATSTAPLVAEVNHSASPDVNTVIIKTIKLKNFSGSGTSYVANWEVAFDDTKLVRHLNPILIPTTLMVDNANPLATTITGCSGSGGSVTGGQCPSGQTVIGIKPDGSPLCTTTPAVSGTVVTSLCSCTGLSCVADGSGSAKGIVETSQSGQRCCAVSSPTSPANAGSVTCYLF